MALAPSLFLLFVGRVISGITAATISTAFAYIADVTPPAGRILITYQKCVYLSLDFLCCSFSNGV
jgi:MFS family permease